MNVVKMIAKEIATFLILGLILIGISVIVYVAITGTLPPSERLFVAVVSVVTFIMILTMGGLWLFGSGED